MEHTRFENADNGQRTEPAEELVSRAEPDRDGAQPGSLLVAISQDLANETSMEGSGGTPLFWGVPG